MSVQTVGVALKERLATDEELRGLLIALLPQEADVSDEAISLRFMEQFAPGSSELPCVVWSRDGDGETTPARCGGFGEQRTRYRVEVVQLGESFELLDPLRARIEELLAGWDSGEFSLVIDGNWARKEPGTSGTHSRLGNYYLVIE